MEVIVIIIVAAVSFAMIFQYFGSFITDSSVPVHRLNYAMELKQTAELIMEHYRYLQYKSKDETPLETLKKNLEDDFSKYKQDFKVKLKYNDFVKFDGNQNDTADPDGLRDLLKVTIKHDEDEENNETITLLLVRQ